MKDKKRPVSTLRRICRNAIFAVPLKLRIKYAAQRVQTNPAHLRRAYGEPLLTAQPLSFPDSEVIMYDPAVSASHRRGLSFDFADTSDHTRLRHSLYRSFLLAKKYITVERLCQSSFFTENDEYMTRRNGRSDDDLHRINGILYPVW